MLSYLDRLGVALIHFSWNLNLERMFARYILWLHLNPHCQSGTCQQDNTNKLFHLVVVKPIYLLQDIPGCKQRFLTFDDGAVLNGCILRDAFLFLFVSSETEPVKAHP